MTVKHFRRFAREWAMQFLFQYDLTSIENKEEAIDVFLAQLEDSEAFDVPSDAKMLRKADRTARGIINGILENIGEIDKMISEYSSKWSIERMATVDRNVMRVAVYEMLFCQNVPPVVSIDEAIEIGKIYGADNTASFINGVLNAVMNTLSRPLREAVPEK
jgi:transcription antitermination protein NusB